MRLECFRLRDDAPRIIPGRPDREWMHYFPRQWAYRCLPMTVANATGWEILCPDAFEIEWDGGQGVEAITIHAARDLGGFVRSHFAGGVVTFETGYLFRTPPGWSTLVTGAPNHVKHGIQALDAIVETDWLPYTFTMNWLFTAPGRVRFERDEPFCFLNLVQPCALDSVEPVIRSLESEPDLKAQFDAWTNSRNEFMKRIHEGEPEAMREAWQRFYFKGQPPQGGGPAPGNHVSKRRLRIPT